MDVLSESWSIGVLSVLNPPTATPACTKSHHNYTARYAPPSMERSDDQGDHSGHETPIQRSPTAPTRPRNTKSIACMTLCPSPDHTSPCARPPGGVIATADTTLYSYDVQILAISPTLLGRPIRPADPASHRMPMSFDVDFSRLPHSRAGLPLQSELMEMSFTSHPVVDGVIARLISPTLVCQPRGPMSQRALLGF